MKIRHQTRATLVEGKCSHLLTYLPAYQSNDQHIHQITYQPSYLPTHKPACSSSSRQETHDILETQWADYLNEVDPGQRATILVMKASLSQTAWTLME